jgi:5-methylcytosine-specific restriction protein A
MTDKRPSSAKARRECFEEHKQRDETGRIYLICHICSGRLDPAREQWEAEHVLPHAFGGKDLRPAHYRCHKHKTATVDVPAIAKSKRVADKYFGIRKRGWSTKWKKKVNGETVPR